MQSVYDSLIFDMDGTLWDAVDSYRKIWDKTLAETGAGLTISRQELLDCMGLPIAEIFRRIVSAPVDATEFLTRLDCNERKMMPLLGGILYPGVTDGIPRLASKYRLFMVSNCGAEGLHNFLTYTKLSPYIEGTLTYGETGKEKPENIKTLVSRHKLNAPIYIGDTQGDCNSAHSAGIPMVYAAYGFGKCHDAEYEVDNFYQLTELFLSHN